MRWSTLERRPGRRNPQFGGGSEGGQSPHPSLIFAVERLDARVPAGGLVHLHAGPRAGSHAVVERPAPTPHGLLGAGLPERRRAVQRRAQRPAPREALVDLFHHLAPEQITASAAL